MTGQRHEPDAHDELDGRLRDYLAARSAGKPGQALESRILAEARGVRQRRRGGILKAPWPGRRSAMDQTRGSLALLSAAVVVVIASVVIGTLATAAPRGPSGASGAIGSPAATTVAASDIAPSAAPHVAGTCPVTPITRLAGGTAPEVDVSGLRWRWGDVPWVAGVDEKVVWLADSGELQPPVSVFATQLDLPILVGDARSAFPSAIGAIYAAAVDAGPAGSVRVPRPGCWLLTATWSAGSSSVVVAVNPPPGAPSSAPPATDPIVASEPLTTCPATPPSTGDIPPGWPGPAVTDGPFRWLLPPTKTWTIGGTGDKLVLDSQVGWAIGELRILAIPLAQAASVGRLSGTVVKGDIPSGFGGGTMGFGVTLPARTCWAFVFLDPPATSTIVADLGH